MKAVAGVQLDRGRFAAADHRVSVPIHGRAESLNLATAAAICLYGSVAARTRLIAASSNA